MRSDAHRSAAELRSLANWYRQYAERAGNPAIWSSRISTADALIQQAAEVESSVPPLKD